MKIAKKIRPKKKKLPSISSLEKKLDTEFQTWVRKSEADEGGTVSCVTCGKLMHWTGDGAQAGHHGEGSRQVGVGAGRDLGHPRRRGVERR